MAFSPETKKYETKLKEDEIFTSSELLSDATTTWNQNVGQDGDWYRRHVTDSVVWSYIGDIKDQVILDAGCGNGYIIPKLVAKGARKVIAVDSSSKIIDIAQQNFSPHQQSVKFIVTGSDKLDGIEDSSVDTIISNFILMDIANLDEAMNSFYRVLKTGGIVSIVILHPCFMSSEYERSGTYPDREINFKWNFCYVEEKTFEHDPRVQNTSLYSIVYHRPLSSYFKAFRNAGFHIECFDEPNLRKGAIPSYPPEKELDTRLLPLVASFMLKK